MTRAILVLALVLLSAACGGAGPQEIAWGREECAACRMLIADQRFAAQLVTTHGKAYSFDAVECLLGFLEGRPVPPGDVGSLWVADATRPGTLIDARAARYLRSDTVRSPMGLGVLAFATDGDLARARAEHAGDAVTWADLPALRRQAGMPVRPPAAGARR